MFSYPQTLQINTLPFNKSKESLLRGAPNVEFDGSSVIRKPVVGGWLGGWQGGVGPKKFREGSKIYVTLWLAMENHHFL